MYVRTYIDVASPYVLFTYTYALYVGLSYNGRTYHDSVHHYRNYHDNDIIQRFYDSHKEYNPNITLGLKEQVHK